MLELPSSRQNNSCSLGRLPTIPLAQFPLFFIQPSLYSISSPVIKCKTLPKHTSTIHTCFHLEKHSRLQASCQKQHTYYAVNTCFQQQHTNNSINMRLRCNRVGYQAPKLQTVTTLQPQLCNQRSFLHQLESFFKFKLLQWSPITQVEKPSPTSVLISTLTSQNHKT